MTGIVYPVQYTFKVMGRREDDFSGYVRALFERLAGCAISNEALVALDSSQGKYVSVSVTVELTSEEQRRAIYTALSGEARIVHYL